MSRTYRKAAAAFGRSSGVISLFLLASLVGGYAEAADDDAPVAFQEQVGVWKVRGGPGLGACIATSPAQGGTVLTIASFAARETLSFALQNAAWKSLVDGDLRVRATFMNAARKITDLWDLDSIGTSETNGGPRINFEILRSRNDGVSFVDQFRTADSIMFWRGTVPIATFDLKNSGSLIDALLRCRTSVRVDKSFDPFAQ